MHLRLAASAWSGDFNAWDGRVPDAKRQRRDMAPVFAGSRSGGAYMLPSPVRTPDGELLPRKADPYARFLQAIPGNASTVCAPDTYQWHDDAWQGRDGRSALATTGRVRGAPRFMASPRRLRCAAIANLPISLVTACSGDLGYTHIELLPVTEHPFSTGAWGYQPTAIFAPTDRFCRTARRFPRYFVLIVVTRPRLGVILDWVSKRIFRATTWG